jgi:hypothetical protein
MYFFLFIRVTKLTSYANASFSMTIQYVKTNFGKVNESHTTVVLKSKITFV